MSNPHKASRAFAGRTNFYDDITKKILAELETGHFPWVQPLGTAAARAPLCLPRNASTGRAYSGINVLIRIISSKAERICGDAALSLAQGRSARALADTASLRFWGARRG